MGRFLLKILIYLTLGFAILFAADYAITKGLQKTQYLKFAKLNDIFQKKIDADLLIVGGSDAKQHFSTKIIDSVLQTKSYNLGIPGHNFYIQHALFDNYLKSQNNKYPKTIIQVVNVNLLRKRKDFYAYKSFLPYLNVSNINEYAEKYEGLKWADYWVPFVRYSGDIELIKIGLTEFFGLSKYSNKMERGYAAYNLPWDEKAMKDYKKSYPRTVEPDETFLLFEKYIADAVANGTKVYLVQTPWYKEARDVNVNFSEIKAIYQSLADKYNIPYFDYSEDPNFADKELYYDYAHLKKPNGQRFSRIIADRISKN